MFDPYQSDVSQQVQILLNLEIDLDTLKILRHTYHDMMLKSQYTEDMILNLQNDLHDHIDNIFPLILKYKSSAKGNIASSGSRHGFK